LKAEAAQANTLKQPPRQVNDLSIQSWVTITQGFSAKLLMLPVSPLLRSLVSEDGSEVVKLYRLGQVMHAMLQIGTADRGRALGAEGHRLTAAVFEGVGLLLHNVSARANGADKEASVLKDRGIDALIAIEPAKLCRLLLNISKVALFLGQNV